jgi:hypothetical protein
MPLLISVTSVDEDGTDYELPFCLGKWNISDLKIPKSGTNYVEPAGNGAGFLGSG